MDMPYNRKKIKLVTGLGELGRIAVFSYTMIQNVGYWENIWLIFEVCLGILACLVVVFPSNRPIYELIVIHLGCLALGLALVGTYLIAIIIAIGFVQHFLLRIDYFDMYERFTHSDELP